MQIDLLAKQLFDKLLFEHKINFIDIENILNSCIFYYVPQMPHSYPSGLMAEECLLIFYKVENIYGNNFNKILRSKIFDGEVYFRPVEDFSEVGINENFKELVQINFFVGELSDIDMSLPEHHKVNII